MPTGVVRHWFDSKGLGFIIPDQDTVDVFAHRHALENAPYLTQCDAVTFVYARNAMKGGWMAVDVVINDSVESRFITRQRPEPVPEPAPIQPSSSATDQKTSHYISARLVLQLVVWRPVSQLPTRPLAP